MCSESSSHHILQLEFPSLAYDPLNNSYVDDINIKLLEHYLDILLSKKAKDTWQVRIQM